MLRMMGVNIEKSALMLGDNKSVIVNTRMPSSVLKKKHCVVNYHRVLEMCTCQVLKFAFIESTGNYADILTKRISIGVFKRLSKPLLFREPPQE